MFCSKCGKEIGEGLRFCTFCGTPVKRSNAQDSGYEPAPVYEEKYEPQTNEKPSASQQSQPKQQGDVADVLKKSMASGGLFNALAGISFGVILIYWISVFLDKFSEYKDDYLVQLAELEYGYIFYILFFLIALAVCVKGLINVLANNKSTKSLLDNKYVAPIAKTKFSTLACMGVLFAESALLEIIRKIIGDDINVLDCADLEIIMYKVCFFYKDIIQTGLWVSLAMLIIGVLANNANKSQQSK